MSEEDWTMNAFDWLKHMKRFNVLKTFSGKEQCSKTFQDKFSCFGGFSAPKTVIYEKEVLLLWFTNHCPTVQWHAVIVQKLFFANKTIVSGYCVPNAEKIIFSYISVNFFHYQNVWLMLIVIFSNNSNLTYTTKYLHEYRDGFSAGT